MNQEKQTAVNAVEEKKEVICRAADQIWEYAELSLQEEKSAAYYCRVLREEGFWWRRESAISPLRLPRALERGAPGSESWRNMTLCPACPRRRGAQSRESISRAAAAMAADTTFWERELWPRP